MTDDRMALIELVEKQADGDLVREMLAEFFTYIGRFWPDPPALPRINGLGWTKTRDKTFAVLGGFWHDAA